MDNKQISNKLARLIPIFFLIGIALLSLNFLSISKQETTSLKHAGYEAYTNKHIAANIPELNTPESKAILASTCTGSPGTDASVKGYCSNCSNSGKCYLQARSWASDKWSVDTSLNTCIACGGFTTFGFFIYGSFKFVED